MFWADLWSIMNDNVSAQIIIWTSCTQGIVKWEIITSEEVRNDSQQLCLRQPTIILFLVKW